MSNRASRLAVAVLVVATAGLCACGGADRGPIVVRVGNIGYGKGQVEHWSHVAAVGAAAAVAAGGETEGAPLQRALAFLISTAWLRGEAARQGVPASAQAVQRALTERREANGSGEFEKLLQVAGQTAADVRLEIEAELAAAAIRRKLLAQVAPVTPAAILADYEGNRRMYIRPEARVVDLVEQLPSPAAARALVSRVGTGAGFSKKAFHEVLPRNVDAHTAPDKEALVRAIFEAPVGAASRPMSLKGHWTVFVVRGIRRTDYTPLGEVRAAIAKRLAARHRSEVFARFTDEYRKRWTAKTSCAPGYVVQRCAQDARALTAAREPFGA